MPCKKAYLQCIGSGQGLLIILHASNGCVGEWFAMLAISSSMPECAVWCLVGLVDLCCVVFGRFGGFASWRIIITMIRREGKIMRW